MKLFEAEYHNVLGVNDLNQHRHKHASVETQSDQKNYVAGQAIFISHIKIFKSTKFYFNYAMKGCQLFGC